MALLRVIAAGLLLITTILSSLNAQKRAFPQQVDYPNCIKPSHISQEKMDAEVNLFYTGWKKDILKSAGNTPDGYYIHTGGGTGSSGDAVTVSEAHGYGMIIFALIAGKDAEAKTCFDGMYKVFRDHPSEVNDDLMSWEIRGGDGFELDAQSSTATDGDLDIAYALLLAHDQWGSDGDIDYLSEAKKMIAAIKSEEMGSQSKRVLLGSWDYNQWSTRSSDWMGGHLHAFNNVTDDAFWNQAAETIYEVFTAVSNSTTGLVPDFVVGQTPVPASPNFLEGSHDGDYYNNACRVPWRIAMDYAHYQTADAKSAVSKLLDWLVDKTNNDPDNISNGYTLSGISINTSEPWGSYLGPFIAGCVVDEKYQDYLNQGWESIKRYYSYGGYYSNTLTLLSMFFISGNWWKQGEFTENKVVEKSWSGDITLQAYSSPHSLIASYTLPHNGAVSIGVYSVTGKCISEVSNAHQRAGHHTVELKFNTGCANGFYFLRFACNDKRICKKISMLQ